MEEDRFSMFPLPLSPIRQRRGHETTLSGQFTFGLTGSGCPEEWRIADDAGALKLKAGHWRSRANTADFRLPFCGRKAPTS
jgi:hypothetical protein